MTPQMIAALSSGRFTGTVLYQLDLPDATRRMMLGSGEAKWGSNTFVGRDSTLGIIDSGDEVSEASDSIAPNTSITVIPDANADLSVIAAPTVQLSPVTIWFAALQLDVSDRVEVVPDPEPIFQGFIDQATINLDTNRDEIDYSIISAFDYFFEDSEGQRLNGAFHQSIWPGEKGLDNVTGVTRKVYWGALGGPGSSGGGNSSIYGPGTGHTRGGWFGVLRLGLSNGL